VLAEKAGDNVAEVILKVDKVETVAEWPNHRVLLLLLLLLF
jgi:hypothetical protein